MSIPKFTQFNLYETLELTSRDQNEALLCCFVPMWHTSSSETVQVTLLTPLGTLGTIWTLKSRPHHHERQLRNKCFTLLLRTAAPRVYLVSMNGLTWRSICPKFIGRSYQVCSWTPKVRPAHSLPFRKHTQHTPTGLTSLFHLFAILYPYKCDTIISTVPLNVESIPGKHIGLTWLFPILTILPLKSQMQRCCTHVLIYDWPWLLHPENELNCYYVTMPGCWMSKGNL
jgi:hypothetical protein